jgi:hypothetical protein
MFLLFSDHLGCFGSILVSVILTAPLVAILQR